MEMPIISLIKPFLGLKYTRSVQTWNFRRLSRSGIALVISRNRFTIAAASPEPSNTWTLRLDKVSFRAR